MELIIKVIASIGGNSNDYDIQVDDRDTMKEALYDMLIVDFPEIEESDLSASDVSFDVCDWGDLSECDSLKDENLFSELAEYDGYNDIEVINAGVYCGISIDNIDEAYAGEYKDDEDFAEETADQLGLVDRNATWPMSCIDWTYAAKELMYDYSEEGGYYFRNL